MDLMDKEEGLIDKGIKGIGLDEKLASGAQIVADQSKGDMLKNLEIINDILYSSLYNWAV